MAMKIFCRFCWQSSSCLRCRLPAFEPQYIVVSKSINATTMSISIREKAFPPEPHPTLWRQAPAGQRPISGLRFILFLYLRPELVAIREVESSTGNSRHRQAIDCEDLFLENWD